MVKLSAFNNITLFMLLLLLLIIIELENNFNSSRINLIFPLP